MAEIGLDVSAHQPRAVADVLAHGQMFAYAITVCDETSAERWPIFPSATQRLHWGFPDPSALSGTREENWPRRAKPVTASKPTSNVNSARSNVPKIDTRKLTCAKQVRKSRSNQKLERLFANSAP